MLVLSRLLPTILRKLRWLLPVTAQVCRYGGGGMRGGFACLCLPLLAFACGGICGGLTAGVFCTCAVRVGPVLDVAGEQGRDLRLGEGQC